MQATGAGMIYRAENDETARRLPTITAAAATYIAVVLVVWLVILGLLIWSATKAEAHDWFPANCCSGFDCRVIKQSDVQTTVRGFVLPGNSEVVPYSSPKIKQTPPEGDGDYAACTKGGKPDGAIICLYIPTWGT
jgi:hypothetical protein